MIKMALNRHERDFERSTVAFSALIEPEKYMVKYITTKDSLKDYIPCGNIDFVEHFLGRIIKPDYYPEWTKEFWHRTIFYSESKKVFLDKGFIVKPADKNKRFQAIKTMGSYKGSKKPPYMVSTLVDINHDIGEWRLYVSDGKIIYCGWYSELMIEEQKLDNIYIDKIQKNIPSGWCGTVDVGFLKNGELVLIECNNPYSCGWYGKIEEYSIYIEWLVSGWNFINKI